jgi:hypothetical protein
MLKKLTHIYKNILHYKLRKARQICRAFSFKILYLQEVKFKNGDFICKTSFGIKQFRVVG